METKKTSKADLEKGRLQAFLMGLVVVLATVFVTLEYSFSSEDYDEADLEALDEWLQDVELAPLRMPEELVPLAQLQKPEQPTRLNIVPDDQDTKQPDEEEETPELPDDSALPDASDAPEVPETLESIESPEFPESVDELPEFPGGAGAFMKWLTRNLTYPQSAQRQKIQGRVLAQFIVNRDGTIANLEIVKSLHPACDRETLRVLGMMPKWKAGKQNHKPCRTMVCIPIVFKL